MQRLAHFTLYNNLVPITISVILLGSSATYAYNNPETLYERTETVVSIDNTYLASLDFDRFSPSVEILTVEEDAEYYYVTYRFNTVALVDAVWQNVTSREELRIPRANVGPSRDLGLYITEELRELVLAEEKRLRETQAYERQQVTRKQVAVEYSGIIGGRLSPEVQTIEGYDPQVTPPSEEPAPANVATPDERSTISYAVVPGDVPPPASVAPATTPTEEPTAASSATSTAEETPTTTDAASDTQTPPTTDPTSNTPETTGETDSTHSGQDETTDGDSGSPSAPATTTATDTATSGAATSNEAPSSTNDGAGTADTDPAATLTVTLLGESLVEIAQGAEYEDLGVVVTDTADGTFTTQTYVNGTLVPAIELDTTQPQTYEIEYRVQNEFNATAKATRTVVVAAATQTSESDDATTTDTTTDTAPPPHSTSSEPEQTATTESAADSDDTSPSTAAEQSTTASDTDTNTATTAADTTTSPTSAPEQATSDSAEEEKTESADTSAPPETEQPTTPTDANTDTTASDAASPSTAPDQE